MPGPSMGLLLVGRSQRHVESLKFPEKDRWKHFKCNLAASVILEFSEERDAICKISSMVHMASMKSVRYASRDPVRSSDRRGPTVSKITPCRELNAGSAKKGNIRPIRGKTALGLPW